MPPPAPQRSQELEESYRIWSGRIQALQKDHDREIDGERRFVLAERVTEAVRYRDEIAKHLAALEQGETPLQPPEPGSLLSEALAAGARLSAAEVPSGPARPAAPTSLPGVQAPSDPWAADFAYDVFISYSHADEEWVEHTLLPVLERAGARVCIDYRDFLPGKAALLNMEDAVKNSRHTLLVLTEHWAASEWTLYEAILVRTKDPAGLQRRTIPVRLDACDLPDAIAMLTWVDFTRPARHEIAWRQLLTAVGKPPPQETAAPPTPAGWHLAHPYAMPPNFTGRRAERTKLTQWLEQDGQHPLLVICALGGFGKSALAWHSLLHDVDAAPWPRVVWWSFYEPEATFERFLAETLAYLGVDPRRYPGPRQQADALLSLLRQPGTLLLLDGFERTLRAYSSMMAAYQGDDVGQIANLPATDCVSPVAEHFLRSLAVLPGLRGKALMTTRLVPRVLQAHDGDLLLGCREIELTQMQRADAVAFFRSQGIRGGRAEIEAACAPYGYHPLSLRLLAGWIKRDVQQPGDITAAQRLDVSGELVQRKHHVLEVAYSSLSPAQQQLLSRIACFRGPVGYEALTAVASQSQTSDFSEEIGSRDQFDADLRDLIDRGLLHRDLRSNRFDLHPIVRRYARDRLVGDERSQTHARLRDYFAAVPPPERVQTLDDLAPVIELYHHTLAAGQYDEARTLFRDRITQATYYQFGAYQLCIELLLGLFPDGDPSTGSGQVATLPRLKEESAQAWTLDALVNNYSLSGQPRRAEPLFEAANAIDEKRGDKKGVAIGLGNLASQQVVTGALRAAEANLRRRIELCREIEDEFREAVGHQQLGRLLAYQGAWDEADGELAKSTRYWDRTSDYDGLCIDECYRSLLFLLMGNASRALASASAAMDAWKEDAKRSYPTARTLARTEWLLGAACRANGNLAAADRHLTEALTRCRGINMVDHEADILLDLARLRRDAAQTFEVSETSKVSRLDEPLRLAEEALAIAERSGYVLQGADVRLFLAQLALDAGDRTAALEHARQARELAACDGPPDYTYKVAYEEAGALLARMAEE